MRLRFSVFSQCTTRASRVCGHSRTRGDQYSRYQCHHTRRCDTSALHETNPTFVSNSDRPPRPPTLLIGGSTPILNP